MNAVTRGVKSALRSPVKSGAIVIMFALSIALLLAMLAARTSVLNQVATVKETAGTAITITPAGVNGFMGGGDPLTAESVATITNTAHVSSVSSTLTDQLGTDDTNLESSLELGSFGQRQNRLNTSDSSESATTESEDSTRPAAPEGGMGGPRTQVIGTTDPDSIATDGGTLTLTSGETINGESDGLVALVGKDLAEKNSLVVGNTFTLFGSTVTVKGIYETSNAFHDSGMVVPLKTLQTLTDQAEAVTSVTATVDSADAVSSTVAALKTSLGDAADITSEAERASTSASSLESIASLTLVGVIGASVAGAAIITLGMILIVRERRREIGVMKAIGGSDRKIISQFVSEGLTITVIGALIGIVLGVLISGPITSSLVENQTNAQQQSQTRGMGRPMGGFPGGVESVNQSITQISASLTPAVFASAIGVTLLVAIIGTIIPAWLTTRIRPAEVLRSE